MVVATIMIFDSAGTAPLKVAGAGSPARYYYIFLLAGGLLLGAGILVWIRRRRSKREYELRRGGRSPGGGDFEMGSSSQWALPLLRSHQAAAVDNGKAKVTDPGITINITTPDRVYNPEVTPWEEYEGAPFDGNNRGLVPLRAPLRLSDEELARRHTPIIVTGDASLSTPVSPTYDDPLARNLEAYRYRPDTRCQTTAARTSHQGVGK
ncbi:hypothetical protein IAQ61_011341 [Plenodomus lingam]|uniref:uncharacterized protein n=1 Tax=Leptosphaeria maculans TaxID=5022 RepID=UPI00332CEF3A|nr:hypothetical protein IAQ61_011341 [Plenodomus lingam]